MANSSIESDEAFSRRLQAQELGNSQSQLGIDAQTPLMLDGRPNQNGNQNGNQNRNNEVVNHRVNELTSARAGVCAILIVYAPQIIAAVVILSTHWDDQSVCDKGHAIRWKYWAATSTFRMFWYSFVVIINHVCKPWLETRPNEQAFVTHTSHLVDAFGLFWFIVGNMWLFGDDELGCPHPERSPVYNLCLCMLVINYIQICLPCIVAVLMIPVFYFCMPCLIRALARLNDPQANRGATDDIISTLPVTIISQEHVSHNGDDNSCPICLNDMILGEEARKLPCDHLFHKQCVDEWLRVNATCPTCRKSILPTDGSRGQGGNAEQVNGNGNMINISHGDRPGQRLITLNFEIPGDARIT